VDQDSPTEISALKGRNKKTTRIPANNDKSNEIALKGHNSDNHRCKPVDQDSPTEISALKGRNFITQSA